MITLLGIVPERMHLKDNFDDFETSPKKVLYYFLTSSGVMLAIKQDKLVNEVFQG